MRWFIVRRRCFFAWSSLVLMLAVMAAFNFIPWWLPLVFLCLFVFIGLIWLYITRPHKVPPPKIDQSYFDK